MIVRAIPQFKTEKAHSRFEIELATEADELELRDLLCRSSIPGSIQVTFEREPSFFQSCRIRGEFFQVGVGRDRRTGRIIGLGTRSVAPAFVNAMTMNVGYLADLRLEPEYRGGTLIARGYRFLRQVHGDGRTQLYTTVIFASNDQALTTIASGRAGLPRYHDMGLVHSPGINLRRRKSEMAANCDIMRGSDDLLPEIVACLNRNHARRQFAPVRTVATFRSEYPNFKPDNFCIALRGSKVVGVVGKWDQRSFKQTRIVGYGDRLRWLVPLANMLRPIVGCPAFPKAGQEVPYFYISFIAVDNDELPVFRALLRHVYNDSVGGDHLYAMLAFHERDPLLPALREYSLTPFLGRLFCVAFEDGEAAFCNLDGRIPYVEAATL
jgi:hypothetical protein